jgi:hypothetical protein
VSDIVYSRAPDVVWRLAPGRVLVRRVGGHGEDAAAELFGEAALAWIALDEPGTIAIVVNRTTGVTLDITAEVLRVLASRGWLWTSGPW